MGRGRIVRGEGGCVEVEGSEKHHFAPRGAMNVQRRRRRMGRILWGWRSKVTWRDSEAMRRRSWDERTR
eukprot:scaffold231789_cov33-Tisochrysis_lutea.AAC.1